MPLWPFSRRKAEIEQELRAAVAARRSAREHAQSVRARGPLVIPVSGRSAAVRKDQRA